QRPHPRGRRSLPRGPGVRHGPPRGGAAGRPPHRQRGGDPMTTPTPRVHLSEAEAAELRAELARARADLARAQELIAELRDVAERADRAFARYDTGGAESAVDGQTPATGRGMGRDANGAQAPAQAVQSSPWDEPGEPTAYACRQCATRAGQLLAQAA